MRVRIEFGVRVRERTQCHLWMAGDTISKSGGWVGSTDKLSLRHFQFQVVLAQLDLNREQA
jgi:hypothetical protein